MSKIPTGIPTDLDFVRTVYLEYKDAYLGYGNTAINSRGHEFKIDVDLRRVASKLGTDIRVLAHLCWHINRKHGHRNENVDGLFCGPFYDQSVETGKAMVDMPYLASVLADLEHRDLIEVETLKIAKSAKNAAIGSVVAAVISVLVGLIQAWPSTNGR